MSRRDPDHHCAICGKYLGKQVAHRCAKTVYSAIDAANTRMANDTYELRIADPMSRSYPERLAAGFALLEEDEITNAMPYMSARWWTQRRNLEGRRR